MRENRPGEERKERKIDQERKENRRIDQERKGRRKKGEKKIDGRGRLGI